MTEDLVVEVADVPQRNLDLRRDVEIDQFRQGVEVGTVDNHQNPVDIDAVKHRLKNPHQAIKSPSKKMIRYLTAMIKSIKLLRMER